MDSRPQVVRKEKWKVVEKVKWEWEEIGPGGESSKKLRFQLRAGKSLFSSSITHVYQIQSVIKGHFFPHPQPSNC